MEQFCCTLIFLRVYLRTVFEACLPFGDVFLFIFPSGKIKISFTVPSGEADWPTITQEPISWLRSIESERLMAIKKGAVEL